MPDFVTTEAQRREMRLALGFDPRSLGFRQVDESDMEPDAIAIVARCSDATWRLAGSRRMRCSMCQEPVWVAPSTMALAARLICVPCARPLLRHG